MSAKKKKAAAAGVFAIAAAAAISASVAIGSKVTELQQQCVTRPTDGGVCWLKEQNATAPIAAGALIPVERTSGQCTEPQPCPKEKRKKNP